MPTRVTIISALVTCLVLIAGITVARALSIGGVNVTGINSVLVESILKELKNADITEPAYEAVMFLQEISATCTSPSGNTGATNNGRPFGLDNVAVTESQIIDPEEITKNGRFLSEIIFSNQDLADAVGRVCNTGWTLEKLVVNRMQVFGTLFSCQTGGDPTNPRATGCAIADALGKRCVAPAGVDLFNAEEFEYVCETICEDLTDPCPQPPTELPYP